MKDTKIYKKKAQILTDYIQGYMRMMVVVGNG